MVDMIFAKIVGSVSVSMAYLPGAAESVIRSVFSDSSALRTLSRECPDSSRTGRFSVAFSLGREPQVVLMELGMLGLPPAKSRWSSVSWFGVSVAEIAVASTVVTPVEPLLMDKSGGWASVEEVVSGSEEVR